MGHKTKNYLPSNIVPLILILLSIICVFIISRTLTYLILVKGFLPQRLFLNIGGFRLHHFVYGNLIITVTSFLAIGLGIRRHKNLFAVCYGIGLGLVLDEFLLWIGDVSALTSNVMWIPHSISALSYTSLFIATVIMIKLYNLHRLSVVKNIHKKLKLR